MLNAPALASPPAVTPPAPERLPGPPVARPPRPEPTAAPAATADDEPPPRDYAAELLQALGSPIDCLRPRKGEAAPPALRIDVEAHVMPSGGVGRALARCPDLDAGELACIRRRAEGLRLQAPIEGAPRQVDATIHLTRKPADAPPK
jgi:hypothetical protein